MTSLCSPFWNSVEGSSQSLLTVPSISLSEQEISCSRPAIVCLWGWLQDTPLPFTNSQAVTPINDSSWVYLSHVTTAARLTNSPLVVYNCKHKISVCYLFKTLSSICPVQSWVNINLYMTPFFPPATICFFAVQIV